MIAVPLQLADLIVCVLPSWLTWLRAVAVAVSLPWSTSATGILIAPWLIAVLPTLEVGWSGANLRPPPAACRSCSGCWLPSGCCGPT